MMESPNPLPNSPSPRPWYRPFRSTWVVVAIVATFFVLLNVPGEIIWREDTYRSQPAVGAVERFKHGWPRIYLNRTRPFNADDLDPPTGVNWLYSGSWRFDGSPMTFRLSALIYDLLVAVAITTLFAAIWQRRKLRRLRIWQFSLGEFTLGVTALASTLAWWQWKEQAWARDLAACRASGLTSEEANALDDAHLGPDWLRKLVGIDILRGPLYALAVPSIRKIPDYGAYELVEFDGGPERNLARLELLKEFDTLETVDFSAYALIDPLDDNALKYLKGVDRLRSLNLSYNDISDAGLEHLVSLGNLRKLVLNHTYVTPAGLAHLAQLKQLRYLDIRSTRVTAEAVRELERALPQTTIRCDNVDWIIKQIEESLGRNDVASSVVIDESLPERPVVELNFDDDRIWDFGIPDSVKKFVKLRKLPFEIPSPGHYVHNLNDFPYLRTLNLAERNIDDGDVFYFRDLHQLQSLDLSRTKLTDVGLVQLQVLTNLRELNVTDTKVTDEGVADLEKALPDLKIVR